MVSFFGLKLGGDRKKSHDKQKAATRQIQHLHRDDQEFTTPKDRRRLTNSSNFSRPNLTRPDTASSNRDLQLSTEWRAPYMNSAGGASSMVDLSALRPPAMGNPRFHSSDVNLNTRFANDSSTSLAAPAAVGAASTSRPATPTRPGTATSRREFENPFNVHFGKDSISSLPGSPFDTDAKSTLDQFEFGLGDDKPAKDEQDQAQPNNTGYPSPPPSIVNAERPFSPASQENRPSSSRRNAPAPSGLRNVDVAGPTALPSPAASVADVWDAPVIRNVQAKRDTLTFHTPRRKSFAMEVDATRDSSKPIAEGFAGNFAGFDFGDTVRRGSVSNRSLETPTSEGRDRESSEDDAVEPEPESERDGVHEGAQHERCHVAPVDGVFGAGGDAAGTDAPARAAGSDRPAKVTTAASALAASPDRATEADAAAPYAPAGADLPCEPDTAAAYTAAPADFEAHLTTAFTSLATSPAPAPVAPTLSPV
ncbi:hypothetical protein FZEAL_3629, partial [Fusarium zealandicum]